MPIYEYQCTSCGERTEALQRVSDPPLATCPQCGGELKKLISAPAFQFKGSGWYVTDYARPAAADGKSGDKGDATGAKTDGTGAEAKTATADAAAAGGSEKKKSDTSVTKAAQSKAGG